MRFPPAWYPDPTGRHDHRWWDGTEWTAHVADAGAAGTDPLPTSAPGAAPRSATAGAAETSDTARPRGTAPGIAVAALVVGLAAALLGWVPFIGVAVAICALTLAIVAIRRTRSGAGRGLAVTGVVAASLGLLAGLATTWVAALLLADGAGGAFGRALRDHVTCLEDRPAAECEQQLTEQLLGLLDG